MRMKPRDLDAIVVGTPRQTGDDWYFAPRPAESLDDAEVAIVSVPIRSEELAPEEPDAEEEIEGLLAETSSEE